MTIPKAARRKHRQRTVHWQQHYAIGSALHAALAESMDAFMEMLYSGGGVMATNAYIRRVTRRHS
jgi:hypothetical protein